MAKKIIVFLVVILSIIAISVGYSYEIVSNGPIEPLGRLAFVKLLNPDFYPGHPHSKMLAHLAQERNSTTALVVHMAGGSNYRSYPEGNVYIIEVAFIDTQGIGSAGLNQINFIDSLKVALYGVPDGRYKYMADGKIYDTYDEMMEHVNTLAKQHNQTGPIPIIWHGNARTDNPQLVQGDGFPLYFQILTKQYGLIPAYVYMVYGMIFPYMNNPYTNFELSHATELQNNYNEGLLNFDFKESHTNTSEYYKNNQNSYEYG